MKVTSESEIAQSCPTPSDPMDCSLPGFSVHGSLQARVLEWVAIAFSAQRKLEVLNLQSRPLNILTQASSPVPFNTTTPPTQLLSEAI